MGTGKLVAIGRLLGEDARLLSTAGEDARGPIHVDPVARAGQRGKHVSGPHRQSGEPFREVRRVM